MFFFKTVVSFNNITKMHYLIGKKSYIDIQIKSQLKADQGENWLRVDCSPEHVFYQRIHGEHPRTYDFFMPKTLNSSILPPPIDKVHVPLKSNPGSATVFSLNLIFTKQYQSYAPYNIHTKFMKIHQLLSKIQKLCLFSLNTVKTKCLC